MLQVLSYQEQAWLPVQLRVRVQVLGSERVPLRRPIPARLELALVD